MKRATALVAISLIAACSTVPEKANFTATLPGNYQAIADCAYVGLREIEPAWAKTDLAIQSRSELSITMDGMAVAKIVVSAAGDNLTVVESHHPPAVWSSDFWEKKHRPIFERCSAHAATTAAPQ